MSLRISTIQIFVISFCFLLFEWLFLVTKPSLLSSYGFWEKIAAFFVAQSIAAIGLIGINTLLYWICKPLGKKIPAFNSGAFTLTGLIAACLLLLFLDNFTYVLTGVGIIRLKLPWTTIFFICFLLFWAIFTLHIEAINHQLSSHEFVSGVLWKVCLGLVIGGFGIFSFSGLTDKSSFETSGSPLDSDVVERPPNILIFSVDGVDSTVLSAYGFDLETTPFLNEFSKEAIVFENAFANASRTTGSLTSLLSGRHATTTKVAFPPQILHGKDAFQHLPGLLSRWGYRNYQHAVPYYADAFYNNMLGGFEIVNQRAVPAMGLDHLPEFFMSGVGSALPLLYQTLDRIGMRVSHIMGLHQMVNPFDLVRLPASVYGVSDDERITGAMEFIRGRDEPWLVHIHMMGTHCCQFTPNHRRFSSESETDKGSDLLFYDTVYEADQNFKKIILFLDQIGQLDNTITIFGSDHGRGWTSDVRVPLLIRFPNGAHHSRVKENVQLLDVAPTIVEFLRKPIPAWMEGTPFLPIKRRDPLQPIFAVGGIKRKSAHGLSQLADIRPPIYGVSHIVGIFCQRRIQLDIQTGRTEIGTVDGHTAPCPEEALPSQEAMKVALIQHLQSREFYVQIAMVENTNHNTNPAKIP